MSEVRACLICGSGNSAQVARCWVCGADLTAAPPPGAAAAPPPAATYDKSTRALQVVGWSSLLLGIGFTAILIAVELGLNWPGMLIPYAVIVLVAFVALGRTAWVQLKKKPTLAAASAAGGPEGGAAPKKGVTGPDVMQSVALGLAIAMAVIAGLMLLAVAAVVIFFLICLVLVSSSGMH
ncbi:MAG: hypothetical protein H6719_34575 [Sandaracinaceae bacterium]|nr:hypothetical protein [Sandaracinaceae bacterium]